MWDAGVQIFREFGLQGGFFIAAHVYAYSIVRGWLADLRRENRRLAEENRQHRDRFERMFDKIEHMEQKI